MGTSPNVYVAPNNELLVPLAHIRGYADDSGEGRWTVSEAVRLGVPAPAISSALFARFASRQTDSDRMKVIAALRKAFGGHPIKSE